MRLVLACVGRLKAGPEREIATRYLMRAAAGARAIGLTGVDLREIDESRSRRPEDRRVEEAKALRALIAPGARVIALDERGGALTSERVAADIGRARDAGAAGYVLAIGGADGFDPEFRESAHLTIAFGAMTWPHQLARPGGRHWPFRHADPASRPPAGR